MTRQRGSKRWRRHSTAQAKRLARRPGLCETTSAVGTAEGHDDVAEMTAAATGPGKCARPPRRQPWLALRLVQRLQLYLALVPSGPSLEVQSHPRPSPLPSSGGLLVRSLALVPLRPRSMYELALDPRHDSALVVGRPRPSSPRVKITKLRNVLLPPPSLPRSIYEGPCARQRLVVMCPRPSSVVEPLR